MIRVDALDSKKELILIDQATIMAIDYWWLLAVRNMVENGYKLVKHSEAW